MAWKAYCLDEFRVASVFTYWPAIIIADFFTKPLAPDHADLFAHFRGEIMNLSLGGLETLPAAPVPIRAWSMGGS